MRLVAAELFKPVLVVGVSGASRSGKSSTCERLRRDLASLGAHCTVLSQDGRFWDNSYLEKHGFDKIEAPEATKHAAYAHEVRQWLSTASGLDSGSTSPACSSSSSSTARAAPIVHTASSATPSSESKEAAPLNGGTEGQGKAETGPLKGARVLLAEGFVLFHDEAVVELLDLRFWITCSKEELKRRRCEVGKDSPEYFEQHIWTQYDRYRQGVERRGVRYVEIDGEREDSDAAFRSQQALQHIRTRIAAPLSD